MAHHDITVAGGPAAVPDARSATVKIIQVPPRRLPGVDPRGDRIQ